MAALKANLNPVLTLALLYVPSSCPPGGQDKLSTCGCCQCCS